MKSKKEKDPILLFLSAYQIWIFLVSYHIKQHLHWCRWALWFIMCDDCFLTIWVLILCMVMLNRCYGVFNYKCILFYLIFSERGYMTFVCTVMCGWLLCTIFFNKCYKVCNYFTLVRGICLHHSLKSAMILITWLNSSKVVDNMFSCVYMELKNLLEFFNFVFNWSILWRYSLLTLSLAPLLVQLLILSS